MAINMESQFEKIKETVLNADKIFWDKEGEDEYVGPINPIAIIFMHDDYLKKDKNFLVLSESVPNKYLPEGMDRGIGIVFAELDDNFNFKNWVEKDRFLMGLQFEICENGTLEGVCSEERKDEIFYNILFRK